MLCEFEADREQVRNCSNIPYGVGKHIDYGLLTLLRQDSVGGLQVHTSEGWIEVPPVPESLV